MLTRETTTNHPETFLITRSVIFAVLFGPFGVRGQYIKVFWFFKSCRSRRELSNALVKSVFGCKFVEIWPF